ncbi:Putative vitamin uptake transporter [Candidatus Hepatincola sp. Av]
MMNYKLKYKIRTVDFYLIILLLLFSVCSHLIAAKIIILPCTNIPLMSSTFTYMFVFPLTDLVRAYSTKLNALKFFVIEMVFIIILIIMSYLLTLSPSPLWALQYDFNRLFYLAFAIYKANFIGILGSMICDILLFSFLFDKILKRVIGIYWNFIFSSIISSIIAMLIYVYITDYIFLYKMYPSYWLKITNYNFVSDIIMIIFYSLICSIIFKCVNYYLGKE